jgi:hypothetical protein
MGLVHHAWQAILRIYNYIYDLLGLGAVVNLVFRAVVSIGHSTPHTGKQRLQQTVLPLRDVNAALLMQMWFVELDLVPDSFLRRCIRLLLKIRLISVSVAV